MTFVPATMCNVLYIGVEKQSQLCNAMTTCKDCIITMTATQAVSCTGMFILNAEMFKNMKVLLNICRY